jgi:hypothetical protein
MDNFELKKIMDAKLKCQHLCTHKIENDVWMRNATDLVERHPFSYGKRSPAAVWEKCETCNK